MVRDAICYFCNLQSEYMYSVHMVLIITMHCMLKDDSFFAIITYYTVLVNCKLLYFSNVTQYQQALSISTDPNLASYHNSHTKFRRLGYSECTQC